VDAERTQPNELPPVPQTPWQRFLGGARWFFQWVGVIVLLVGAGVAVVMGLGQLRTVPNKKVDDDLRKNDAEADQAVVDAQVTRDSVLDVVVIDQQHAADDVQRMIVQDTADALADDPDELTRRLLDAGRRAQQTK
jgi:hypothetical protein